MTDARDRALVRAGFEMARTYSTLSREGEDAVVADVTREHPAPALPRDVAMRVAREYGSEVRESLGEEGPSWAMTDTLDTRLAAIVSRHLPADEEREAADAVVEAAMREAQAREALRRLGLAPSLVAVGELTNAEVAFRAAADRLLAIRAKR